MILSMSILATMWNVSRMPHNTPQWLNKLLPRINVSYSASEDYLHTIVSFEAVN